MKAFVAKEFKSALTGKEIQKLQRGEKISSEAGAELKRVLDILMQDGWTGAITADEALAVIILRKQR